MRIWDVDPGFLNDKSLLGEHRELHGLFSIHVNKKKGYAKHPETLRWTTSLSGLFARHEILVSEMQLRGFNHKSPLEASETDAPEPDSPDAGGKIRWPGAYIDPPGNQYALLKEKYRDKAPGRIPLPGDIQGLWSAHKYSVMARDPELYRAIGPQVARKKSDFHALSLTLTEVLRQPPSPGRLVNALDHMWGYVSHQSPRRRQDLGPGALLGEIRSQARDQGIGYLLRSTALGELGAWVQGPDSEPGQGPAS